MVHAPTSLQFRQLRRADDDETYRLYRAALEWDLDDPIVIEDREDLQSEASWRKSLEPFDHQVTNLITFCRRLPVTLLADDVGLGKTISAGLVVSELISRGRVSRILIVCPKLLMPQWKAELATKFNIASEICPGKKLVTAEPEWDTGAIITTYTSARLYLEKIPRDRFDMLILDEAHKLRNLYGVDPTPQVATRFRKALADRLFRYVLMLTATPIQNRLWDLYSLVDLLTVARGHENPFGSEGMFVRKFVADKASEARRLKPEAREEFRSIVYGYMSRVRRGDANLQFPERIVQMHTVPPTVDELNLIAAIAKPIQKLNRLAQISILQALTSSPHALAAQLGRMADKGTFPRPPAEEVKAIVAGMGLSAKIHGVGALVDELRAEHPERWRMVVFTGRLETQTTIQEFLERRGVRVGIINGSSGQRNQDTIARFWKDPPDIHVIVSTEAGSEGVNLQAANVLVNYDLPWNPMIVEQRIGRIQRLASRHANVCIYNITLAGTFEQYIVGRLMEKLQMASHAIGDVEALLEASGMEDDDQGGFEEQLRALVVASLAGIDVEAARKRAENSIAQAKAKLENEEKNINDMLGGMDGAADPGPRTPNLPPHTRSMSVREFTLATLGRGGATITARTPESFLVEQNSGYEVIRFSHDDAGARSILYTQGSPAFERLVRGMADKGFHKVQDADHEALEQSVKLAMEWTKTFAGATTGAELTAVTRCYSGNVVVRVRATVAHDSYERLVVVPCNAPGDAGGMEKSLQTLPAAIQDVGTLGLKASDLLSAARSDEAVSEFCRFYLERKTREVAAAGENVRKRQKLEDEFTPRLEMAVVGLEGEVCRELGIRVQYKLDPAGSVFSSELRIKPSTRTLIHQPAFETCKETGRSAPVDCLAPCAISGSRVLRDLLVKSEISERFALPSYIVACSLSQKEVLSDEVELSDVTGSSVAKTLMKRSAVSGKKAEPAYFGCCAFTEADALEAELATSAFSGKKYRADQAATSMLSGKTGHASELVNCTETGTRMGVSEAERSDSTGRYYKPGILARCAVTQRAVPPHELEPCAVSGQRVLRDQLKTSAVSALRALPEHFGRCDFTQADALIRELRKSDISGRRYRIDEEALSAVSGQKGHRSEFLTCAGTGQTILQNEAERCEISGRIFRPGILAKCAKSGTRAHPSELDRCAVSGQKVLKSLLVTSSISQARMLEENAVVSLAGQYCLPVEAVACEWGGGSHHLDGIRVCSLAGLAHHVRFSLDQRIRPLAVLLDGGSRRADRAEEWEAITAAVRPILGGRCTVEAAELSPDGQNIAVVMEIRRMLGFRVDHAGFVFSLVRKSLVGRMVVGQRSNGRWMETRTAKAA